MGHHRFYLEGASLAPGVRLEVSGDEAKHAVRVKRIEPTDTIEALSGVGEVARARLVETRKDPRLGWSLTLEVLEVARVEPVAPRVEVWTAPPKGARLEQMIDQLAQAGAAGWAPMETERTVVHPREGKKTRVERVAAEASKQCGRAWHLEIGAGGTLLDALRAREEGTPVVFADASGGSYAPVDPRVGVVRVLIGPEGGWTDEERALALASGATAVSFGPHVMRIETAAVVAASVVLDRERGGA